MGFFVMRLREICWAVLLIATVAFAQAENDVVKREFKLPSGNKIWIYLPNDQQQESLPCVLIAPAGSRLHHGMHLAVEDEAEHIPYVHAGFIVVAYEISGAREDFETDGEAALSFMKAKGGVSDAAAAYKLAISKVPAIDKEKVYVVGHSSAAILALANARTSSLFKGCVVYCPPINVKSVLAPILGELSSEVSGFGDFVDNYCPMEAGQEYHCPLMVFHASDDSYPVEIRSFIDILRDNENRVTHIEVPAGGHYDSMITEGIPLGVSWMKSISRGDNLPLDVLPSPQENQEHNDVEQTELTTGNIVFFACFGVAAIICILGQIVVLVDAFCKSILWGFGVWLIPFVFPVFVLMHLDRRFTRVGGGLWLAGVIGMGGSALICNALGFI